MEKLKNEKPSVKGVRHFLVQIILLVKQDTPWLNLYVVLCNYSITRRKAVSMAEAEGGSVYFKRTKDSLKNKISCGLNITSSRVLLYFVSAELREIFSKSLPVILPGFVGGRWISEGLGTGRLLARVNYD